MGYQRTKNAAAIERGRHAGTFEPVGGYTAKTATRGHRPGDVCTLPSQPQVIAIRHPLIRC